MDERRAMRVELPPPPPPPVKCGKVTAIRILWQACIAVQVNYSHMYSLTHKSHGHTRCTASQVIVFNKIQNLIIIFYSRNIFNMYSIRKHVLFYFVKTITCPTV